jgi:hypothetical protein
MSKLGKNKINLSWQNNSLLSVNKNLFINSQGILIQKLIFTGPLGTQSMIIPDLFNIEINKTYISISLLPNNNNLLISPKEIIHSPSF